MAMAVLGLIGGLIAAVAGLAGGDGLAALCGIIVFFGCLAGVVLLSRGPAPAPASAAPAAPTRSAGIPLGYSLCRQGCLCLAILGGVIVIPRLGASRDESITILCGLILLMGGIIAAGIMQIAGMMAARKHDV
jgi:hypothetical protein